MYLIKNFLDCPEVLPIVAEWIHHEFWANKEGHSPTSMLARLRQGQRNALPIGYVAFDGEIPVGTVSLIECDLEERADLSPWLAALYVTPEARRAGVGESLVRRSIAGAAEVGFSFLYLYTSIPDYYERLGGERISTTTNPSEYIIRFKTTN
jgi:predicted N-acetyltransferase YhbS